jgi:DNA mismatch repair protein MutS
LGQLILFLYRIQRFYFSALDDQGFPSSFGDRIRNIKSFFLYLEVSKFHAIAIDRSFRAPEIKQLTRLLLKASASGMVGQFWRDFFLFEAYLSVSKGILRQGFRFPDFSHRFSITGFYHPLLRKPVKNNLDAKGAVTLITGPNMSGKSTVLRSIGICVYLAHLGFAVPADRCELPFFDVISISTDLKDDLLRGYSHFMTEINSLKELVLEAQQGRKCFAVFDELFRGTNTEDAIAISRITILGLTRFSGSYFFISTHLHQLKDSVQEKEGAVTVLGVECSFENHLPNFTYQIRKGWSELKIGQFLFDQAGLGRLLERE